MVLFLSVSPETALSRIASRYQKIDCHENVLDLAQARQMYAITLEALEGYQKSGSVHPIVADGLSPGETLRAAVESLRPRIAASECTAATSETPLGTATAKFAGISLWRMVFDWHYIF